MNDLTARLRGGRPGSALARFAARIKILDSGCWEWTGFVRDSGYGACGYRGVRSVLAHRAVYTELVGEIPTGMTLDHLCHNRDLECEEAATCRHRRCVNPEHLEPATAVENSSRAGWTRRTRCINGHAWTPENTRLSGRRRHCLACRSARNQKKSAVRSATRAAVRAASGKSLNPAADAKRAQTHCKQGHEFDEVNTYINPDGTRRCRECRRIGMRGSKAKARGAVA
jgi:hypothetical protein